MPTPKEEMAAKATVTAATLGGALAGSAFGPVGAVVGGAVGFLGSTVGAWKLADHLESKSSNDDKK